MGAFDRDFALHGMIGCEPDVAHTAFGESHFGADYDMSAATVRLVQAAANKFGYTPALVVDGAFGPKTSAGVKWAQAKLQVSVTGVIDDATLKAMGINAPAPSGQWPADPIRRPTRAVAIATMAKALRQAGTEMGHSVSDTLLALMMGQMLGAEGAMPGLWDGPRYTLRGTNNIGAAQVPGGSAGQAFASAHKTMGWGAYAHRDSNPGNDAYLGWYYIAPSALEAARHWLSGFAGTKAVLAQNPSTPEEYASIMYASHYFAGTSTNGPMEIAAYAGRIRSAMPSADVMNGPANEPAALSVAPEMFDTLSARQITEDLFTKAKAGKSGSAWAYLLPAAWSGIVGTNGVVWFGPPPSKGGIVSRMVAYMKAVFTGKRAA